jgi:hypothetical protein
VLSTDSGTITLDAGRRVVSTYDLSNVLIQSQVKELATLSDSTLILTRYFSESLEDAWGIPDYGDEDELEILFLNDANQSLWGPAGDVEDDTDEDAEGEREDG